MYPFPETAGLLPQVSDTAWAFNAQAASGIVSAWQRVFSRYVGGLPEKFTEKGFYEVAQDAVDGQYLLPAPDERIFEDIVKGNLVPGERYP